MHTNQGLYVAPSTKDGAHDAKYKDFEKYTHEYRVYQISTRPIVQDESEMVRTSFNFSDHHVDDLHLYLRS